MTKIRATAATPSRVSTALEWLTTSCRAMAKSSTSVTARGVEHQHFDKFDAHHDGHGVGEEGVGAEAPPQHLGKGSLPQKEQLQQGDGQNEDGDHQLQNPGRLEQALDKV